MSYIFKWDEVARIALRKLEPHISKRIVKKTKELQEDPFSKDIKHLRGQHGFRLRVGDYRVIFAIEGNEIHVLKVGHRKHIYDR